MNENSDSAKAGVRLSWAFLAPALVLDVVAVVLIVAGLVAYFNAPAGAAATTALVIPGVAAGLLWIAGIFALLGIRNVKLGRIGVVMGIVLLALFSGLFTYTAYSRHEALRNYPAAKQEWEQALAAGEVQDEDQAKRAFFRERGAARSDISYLVNTLWVVSGASILGFAATLALWPRARDAARRQERGASPFAAQPPLVR